MQNRQQDQDDRDKLHSPDNKPFVGPANAYINKARRHELMDPAIAIESYRKAITLLKTTSINDEVRKKIEELENNIETIIINHGLLNEAIRQYDEQCDIITITQTRETLMRGRTKRYAENNARYEKSILDAHAILEKNTSHDKRQFMRAYNFYNEALTINPNRHEAYLGIADVFEITGNLFASMSWRAKALETLESNKENGGELTEKLFALIAAQIQQTHATMQKNDAEAAYQQACVAYENKYESGNIAEVTEETSHEANSTTCSSPTDVDGNLTSYTACEAGSESLEICADNANESGDQSGYENEALQNAIRDYKNNYQQVDQENLISNEKSASSFSASSTSSEESFVKQYYLYGLLKAIDTNANLAQEESSPAENIDTNKID